jgi:hypothetical protein
MAAKTSSTTPAADYAIQSVIWLANRYGCFITGSFLREHVSAYLNDPGLPYYVALNNVIIEGSWTYKRFIAKGDMVKVIMSIHDLRAFIYELKRLGLNVTSTKEHMRAAPDISFGDFGVETVDGTFTLRVHWKDISLEDSRFYPDTTPPIRRPIRLEDFESIVEFECDNLVLNPSMGTVATMIPNRTIQNVLDMTKNKVTVLRRNDPQQTSKLFDLGWTVVDRCATVVDNNPQCPETCVICLEEFSKPHIKRSCCNARYHFVCITRVLCTSTQCPMCRSPIP